MYRTKLLGSVYLFAALALSGCGVQTAELPSTLIKRQTNPNEIIQARTPAGFPDRVYFALNSHEPDAEAKSVLKVQAQWLRSRDNLTFSVTGHTDRLGNAVYNRELGLKRAQSVIAFLVSEGVREDQLVALTSMGEDQLAVETDAAAHANRRVVTAVMAKQRPGKSAENTRDESTIVLLPTQPDISGETPSQGPAEGQANPVPADNPFDAPASEGDNQPSSPGGTESGGVDMGYPDGNAPGLPGNDPTDEGHDQNGAPTSPGNQGGNEGSPSNSSSNSGRGNGDEGSDPGNSAGHNQGGDEVGSDPQGSKGRPNDRESPSRSSSNSGRGNGDEDGDPGNSEGHNRGGDEL